MKPDEKEYQEIRTFCKIKEVPCSWIWEPINRQGVENCSNCIIAQRDKE